MIPGAAIRSVRAGCATVPSSNTTPCPPGCCYVSRPNHVCEHGRHRHCVRLQWRGSAHRVETRNQLQRERLQRERMLWYALYLFACPFRECTGRVVYVHIIHATFVSERPQTCADTTGVGDSEDKVPINCTDQGPMARLSTAHCADLPGGCSASACCGKYCFGVYDGDLLYVACLTQSPACQSPASAFTLQWPFRR